MSTKAMSTAEKDKHKFSSCLHVRKFMFDFFHRAKPVNEENRRFSECAVRMRSASAQCEYAVNVRSASAQCECVVNVRSASAQFRYQ